MVLKNLGHFWDSVQGFNKIFKYKDNVITIKMQL